MFAKIKSALYTVKSVGREFLSYVGDIGSYIGVKFYKEDRSEFVTKAATLLISVSGGIVVSMLSTAFVLPAFGLIAHCVFSIVAIMVTTAFSSGFIIGMVTGEEGLCIFI